MHKQLNHQCNQYHFNQKSHLIPFTWRDLKTFHEKSKQLWTINIHIKASKTEFKVENTELYTNYARPGIQKKTNIYIPKALRQPALHRTSHCSAPSDANYSRHWIFHNIQG